MSNPFNNTAFNSKYASNAIFHLTLLAWFCCCFWVTKLCPTLCNLMDCIPQVRLFMGFPRQGYWSGLLFPSLEDFPDSGIEPVSPVLAGGFPTAEPLGSLSLILQTANKPDSLIYWCWEHQWASLIAQLGTNLPAMQETLVRIHSLNRNKINPTENA